MKCCRHRACGNRACAAARPRAQVWRPWRCAAECRNAISRRAWGARSGRGLTCHNWHSRTDKLLAMTFLIHVNVIDSRALLRSAGDGRWGGVPRSLPRPFPPVERYPPPHLTPVGPDWREARCNPPPSPSNTCRRPPAPMPAARATSSPTPYFPFPLDPHKGIPPSGV